MPTVQSYPSYLTIKNVPIWCNVKFSFSFFVLFTAVKTDSKLTLHHMCQKPRYKRQKKHQVRDQRKRHIYSAFHIFILEPPHDKTNKMTVRSAKTEISLGIRPVWSESSLCAQWVAKDSSFLHADSKASDQTGRMPRLIWVFAGRTCHFVGFIMRRLILCICIITGRCSVSRVIQFSETPWRHNMARC